MDAVTQTSIVNLALRHISQKRIASMTETSAVRIAASDVWDFCVKETLRGYHWGFAKVIVELTENTAWDPLDYTYAYTYPSDCVAMRFIYNEETTNKTIGEKFRVVYDKDNSATVIETDCDDAYGEYTYLQETVTTYDSYFISALSHRIAAELAMALNADPKMFESQMNVFNVLISEAHRHSSYEHNETHQANEQSGIVDARG